MEPFARYITRHPGKVAIAFAVATCFMMFQLIHLRADFTLEAIFNKKSPEYKFYEPFSERFGKDDRLLVIMARGDDIFTPRGLTLLEEVTDLLQSIPELHNIYSLANIPEIRHAGEEGFSVDPFLDPPPQTPEEYQELRDRALQNQLYLRLYISPDARTGTVMAETIEDIQTVDEVRVVIEKLEDIITNLSNKYPDFELMLAGIPYVRVDIVRKLISDQMRFLPICFIVTTIIAYLTFRYIRSVVLILTTVMGILIWGMGILSFGGGEINVMNNILPALLMIIGVADSIHLIVRYDEEIRNGLARRGAIALAVRHIGVACFFTSFTTAIGFASLGISTNDLLSHFGIFASTGILAAYVVTITFLPLLLIRWGRKDVLNNKFRQGRYGLERILDGCADFCISHKWILFIIGMLIVIFSFIGGLRTGITNNLFEFHKEGTVVFQSNQVLEESLAGIIPYRISLRGENDLFKDPDFLERISALQQSLEKEPIVQKTLSLADFVKEMNWAFHGEGEAGKTIPASREVIAQYLFLFSLFDNAENIERLVDQGYGWGNIAIRCKNTASEIFLQHIETVKERIRTLFPEAGDDIDINITGDTIFIIKSIDNLMLDMMKSLIMAFVFIFFVIGLEFRSVRIALISIIPNIIPIVLTYGAIGWLGVKLEMTTIVVFTISLGIAVDDSIHFLMRFREEFHKDGNHENAIRVAFRGAGRAIVYTTVILVLGLGVLTLSSLPSTAKLAYLTATTLTSALLADLFILPACILIFRPRI